MAGDARADHGHIVDRPPNHHVRLNEIRQLVDARTNLRHIPIDSLVGSGKTIVARDRRDERDGPNEMESQSVHVARFSHVLRFTRHGLWPLADFFSILFGIYYTRASERMLT